MTERHTVWLASVVTRNVDEGYIIPGIYDSRASAEHAIRADAEDIFDPKFFTLSQMSHDEILKLLKNHDYKVIFQEHSIWIWDNKGCRTLWLDARDRQAQLNNHNSKGGSSCPSLKAKNGRRNSPKHSAQA